MDAQVQRIGETSEAASRFTRRRWVEREARRLLADRDEFSLASLLDELAEFRAGDPARRSTLRFRFIGGCLVGSSATGLLLLATRFL
jgi:hypothetical protein